MVESQTSKSFQRYRQWLQLSGALCLLMFCSPLLAQNNHRVLFLGSYHQGEVWEDRILEGVRKILVPFAMEVNVEYLDSRHNPSLKYGEDFARFIAAKYRSQDIRLVITADDAALDFWMDRRSRLLPDVPVVFCGINNHQDPYVQNLDNTTGILENPDLEGTLNLALKMHPAARKLYIVASDRILMRASTLRDFRRIAKRFENKISIEEILNLSTKEAPARIKAIPPNSILLLMTVLEDEQGLEINSLRTSSILAEYSRAPIYVMGESEMGWGPIGGLVISGEGQGEAAAKIALQILAGERVESIPVIRQNPVTPIFDFIVLKRFGVPESLLPPGSHVLNRPVTLYARYWPWFWGVGIFFLLETWLVIQLLFNRRSRIQTEQELRESEARLKSAQAMAHVGNWEIDLKTQRIWGSEEAFRIYGIASPSAWVPLATAQAMVHPADRPQLDQALKKLIETGEPYEVECRVKQAGDGQWRNVHSRANLVRDSEGHSPKVIGVLQDVTEQKMAATALAESEIRYRMIAENATDLISLHTLEGSYLYVSPAVRSLFGYEPEEMIGHSAFEFIHPEDQVSVEAHRQETIAKQKHEAISYRMRRKDGSWIWMEANSRILPARDPAGEHRLLAISRDVTERRHTEEERIQLERRIQHSQKLESLGVLAGGIAHDFNNLLMAILGNLGLALEDLSSNSPARPYIDDAEQAAHRAADLTRQMLAYSGRGRFVIQSVNLGELVAEMLHLLKSSISKTAVLNLHLDHELPPVMADPGQLQQVVMNLIVNASEAIGDQIGTITLATGTQRCETDYLNKSRLEEKPPAGKFVFLEISDTGCGMDQETQRRLFDPFFTTKFFGRGLGMSAVLGIVRGHQGALMVYSEVKKGTTFKILFPAEDSTQMTAPVKSAVQITHSPHPLFHGLILLVDDEKMVRELGRKMLERLGFQVQTVKDGEDACAFFRQQAGEIRCVLLDLTMPKMDGVATFSELKQIQPEVKVILTSGFNHQDVTQRFAGKGLAGFIQKPYQMQTLQDLLQKILGNSPGDSIHPPEPPHSPNK